MAKQLSRMLCVLLLDWPAQRARLGSTSLRRAPLVFSADDGRTERVRACSSEARGLGVCVGMKTPEAEALAGKCKLIKLRHDPQSDRRALAKLAADCERFSPAVGLEDSEYPEALLMELTGPALLSDPAFLSGRTSCRA